MNKFTVIDQFACYIFSALPIVFLCTCFINAKVRGYNPLKWKEEEYPHADAKQQSIFWKFEHTETWIYIFIVLFLGFSILASLSAHFEHYVSGMIKNLEVATDITMGLTVFAFTLVAAVMVIKKNYYLVFSIQDVLGEYNFSFWIKQLIVSCLGTCVLTLTLLDKEMVTLFDCIRVILFEEFVIYNLLCVTVLFYIVCSIMFTYKKVDLKPLKKLYRVHELKNIDNSQIKNPREWRREDIEVNLSYLFEDYKNQCKRIGVNNIEKIKFISSLKTETGLWKEQAIKRYREFCVCFLLMGIMSTVNFGTMYNFKPMQYPIMVSVHIGIGLVGFMLSCRPKEFIKDTIFYVIWEQWGFYFEIEKKFVTCHSWQIHNRKYVKYMRSFCSLTGFVKIANDIEVDASDMNSILEEKIKDLSESVQNIVGMMPIFIIGYIQYKKGEKLKYVKKAFRNMKIEEASLHDFKEMFQRFTLHMDKGKVNRKKEEKYLEWLCD